MPTYRNCIVSLESSMAQTICVIVWQIWQWEIFTICYVDECDDVCVSLAVFSAVVPARISNFRQENSICVYSDTTDPSNTQLVSTLAHTYIPTYIHCIIYIHSCIHLYYHQIARLSCILHLRTHIYAFICTLYFCDFAYLIAVCARVFFRASVSPVCGIFFIAKLVFRLFSDANLMELSAPESQWKQVWLISWDAYAYYIRVVYTKKTYF